MNSMRKQQNFSTFKKGNENECATKRRMQTITLKNALAVEREAVARLRQAAKLSAKRDADRLTVIAQKDEMIELRNVKIIDLMAERDRLIRMVDQFTSISITPLINAPRELRKTWPGRRN